jgi:hypothetical protein
MTTTGAIILYSAFGAGSVAAAVAWIDGELTLDKMVSGGAAGLVVIMFVIVLRHLAASEAKQQEERGAERASVEKITTEFSATQKATAHSFAETVRSVMDDGRKREAELHTLIRELTQDKA